MDGVIAAFAATGLYYIGFAIFKVAGDRMEPLRGSRPVRTVIVALTNLWWLLGLAIVLGGLALQIVALTTVPIGVATPIFVTGLIPILIIAAIAFGERLTGREWLSLALIAAGFLLVAVSAGSTKLSKTPPADWEIIAIAVPALMLPYLVIALGDHRPDGRHARPVSGLAFGIAAGIPLGTAELAIRGLSDNLKDGLGLLATPYPYVTVITAATSFMILMFGFQRCRVSIVMTVATLIAKTHLLLMGSLLYGEAWPKDLLHTGLRVGGILLALLALALFPHYDPIAENADQESAMDEGEGFLPADDDEAYDAYDDGGHAQEAQQPAATGADYATYAAPPRAERTAGRPPTAGQPPRRRVAPPMPPVAPGPPSRPIRPQPQPQPQPQVPQQAAPHGAPVPGLAQEPGAAPDTSPAPPSWPPR